MSQRNSVNDLESQQCSLLDDHQIIETTDIFLGGPNEKKSRKVVFSVAAVAFAALVIVCSALYWCGSSNDEAHHAVSDHVSANNVVPVDENAGVVATVDGEDVAETGLTAWQWGLIGGGAYIASNILCAAFSWSILCCRVDSDVDYRFKAAHDLLSVDEMVALREENITSFKNATEEEKEEFRKKYAEQLAENEKKFAESKIDGPGCCVSCKPRWEVSAIMLGKSAEEKEKFQAELEKAGYDGEVPIVVGQFTNSNGQVHQLTRNVKVAELQETECCAQDYCGNCVKTALWNFLTLNLCSIVPCALPNADKTMGCECCLKGNACGCAPSCLKCECECGDDGQKVHDGQFPGDDDIAS